MALDQQYKDNQDQEGLLEYLLLQLLMKLSRDLLLRQESKKQFDHLS